MLIYLWDHYISCRFVYIVDWKIIRNVIRSGCVFFSLKRVCAVYTYVWRNIYVYIDWYKNSGERGFVLGRKSVFRTISWCEIAHSLWFGVLYYGHGCEWESKIDMLPYRLIFLVFIQFGTNKTSKQKGNP